MDENRINDLFVEHFITNIEMLYFFGFVVISNSGNETSKFITFRNRFFEKLNFFCGTKNRKSDLESVNFFKKKF